MTLTPEGERNLRIIERSIARQDRQQTSKRRPPSIALDERLATGLAQVFARHVEAKLQPLRDRIAVLEQRASEAHHKELVYRGVWQPNTVYAAGCFISHAGSLWSCVDGPTMTKPGEPDSGWRLAVKKGDGEHPTKRTARSAR